MAPNAPEFEVLRRGQWFASLPSALQARIARAVVPRRFRVGQYLIRQDDPVRGMFGIIQGRTRHLVVVGEVEEVLMHVGGPGLWIGEYPLLAGVSRSIGHVIADTPTHALFLSAQEWQQIVDEDPRWFRHFARLLAGRFAMAIRACAEAQGMSHDERIYSRLRLAAQIACEHGEKTPRIQLSQAQTASMVGVSRQTLSAALARLQDAGRLRVGFRSIELLE